MSLLQVIKAFSDESRLRILNILSYRELCVCEIEEILGVTQSNVSRHLNKLSNANIINYYRSAKYVYYKINEDIFIEFPFIIEIIKKEVMKLEICQKDYEKLKEYDSSGKTCDNILESKVTIIKQK